jgi:hypothetical protein
MARYRRRFPGKDKAQPVANLFTDRAAMQAIESQFVLSAHLSFPQDFRRDNKLQILSYRLLFAAHLSAGDNQKLTVPRPVSRRWVAARLVGASGATPGMPALGLLRYHSSGVGFIMELIRVFATTIRWSISIPGDGYNGPASTSFQKP